MVVGLFVVVTWSVGRCSIASCIVGEWDFHVVVSISLILSTDHFDGVGTCAMVCAWCTEVVWWSYIIYCPVRRSIPRYTPELHLVISGPLPFSFDLALNLHTWPKGMSWVEAPDPLAS